MKKRGRFTSVSLEHHLDILALLNKTIGGRAGSSKRQRMLPRIYRKWKDALPDLENAPLFKIVGKKKSCDDSMDRVYGFSEREKDSWANFLEYKGSHENVRLRFSLDRLGTSLDDVTMVYGEYPQLESEGAWERFIADLKEKSKDIQKREYAGRKLKAYGSPLRRTKSWLSAETSRWQLATVSVMIVLFVGAAVFWIWKDSLFSAQVEVAAVEKMAFPLPDKPSLAVLPFRNLSHDPKQDYFSDGLTEEIITGLSKVPYLFVIAHQSTFTYKGKPLKIKQVSKELGVRYVLEGSVRKADNRIRITAQLIDAIKGHHLWAEQYDRELKDIFAIQDEITLKILTALRVELGEGETGRILEKQTDNLQAYLKILEGYGYVDKWKIDEALRSAEEALTFDPECASIYGLQAWAHIHHLLSPSSTRTQSLKKTFESAKKCAELDDNLFSCKMYLGLSYLWKREYEKAISEGKRAVELNPNSAWAATILGWILRGAGRHEEALKEHKRALRLDPIDPFFALTQQSLTYLLMERNEEAIATCNRVLESAPNFVIPYIVLAVAYSSQGQMDEARSAATKIMKFQPNFSMEHYEKILYYKNQTDKDILINGLRKAGLK